MWLSKANEIIQNNGTIEEKLCSNIEGVIGT